MTANDKCPSQWRYNLISVEAQEALGGYGEKKETAHHPTMQVAR